MLSSDDSSFWERVRRDFPVTKKTIFLGSCAVAPMALPAINAAKAYFDGRGLGERLPLEPIFAKARDRVATLLSCNTSEVAFMRGTTEGVSTVASMIPFHAGENIVLSKLEYTSNVYPWMRQAELQKIKIKAVPIRDEGAWAEDLIRAIDGKTKVVAVSSVQMANGFRLDLDALIEAAHSRDVLVFVDAVQMLGALRLDVSKTKADFVASGGHKWLLGPSGIGILFIRKRLIRELVPTSVGPWQEDLVYSDVIDFSFKKYELSKTAKRYEFGGHPNVPGVLGLSASLGYLQKIGYSKIEKRVLSLSSYLIEKMERARCFQLPSWASNKNCLSSFIGYESRKPAGNVKRLAAGRGINVAPSKTLLGERVRAGVHIFNTEDEIDRAVSLLKRIENS